MATLQKIRNKAGVLVAIVIGIALLAFVLSDFINAGNKGGYHRSDMIIAEVDGAEIPYEAYQTIVDKQIKAYESQGQEVDETLLATIREQSWETLITNHILSYTEARDKDGFLNYILFNSSGIAVHKNELEDMVIGKNVI